MFGAVKSGRRTNATPRDDDNDGRLDEDGPEDLNKDGYISRAGQELDGEYMVDPEEPRVMKKADPKKEKPAPTRSTGRGSTTMAMDSLTRTRPEERISTSILCMNIPISNPMPASIW